MFTRIIIEIIQIEMKINTVYSLNVKAPSCRHDLCCLNEATRCPDTDRHTCCTRPSPPHWDGGGGEGGMEGAGEGRYTSPRFYAYG